MVRASKMRSGNERTVNKSLPAANHFFLSASWYQPRLWNTQEQKSLLSVMSKAKRLPSCFYKHVFKIYFCICPFSQIFIQYSILTGIKDVQYVQQFADKEVLTKFVASFQRSCTIDSGLTAMISDSNHQYQNFSLWMFHTSGCWVRVNSWGLC